jgi:GT2 family glycosyltransferase/tetratricopeptide (TPR) repeat protein/glycosyltransferase involved in cell wall biosynthesis
MAKQEIYVALDSFFPERHSVFLKSLAENFNVVFSQKHPEFHFESAPNISYADEMNPINDRENFNTEFLAEKEKFKKYISEHLKRIDANIKIDDSRFNENTPNNTKLLRSFYNGRLLKNTIQARNIAFVILSAEYGYEARPVLLEARKAGIPVVNLEHGFFLASSYPLAHKKTAPVFTPFLADYVIMDNELDANTNRLRVKLSGQKHQPEFMSFGAPLDAAKQAKRSKEQFLAENKLPVKNKNIVLISTWVEPRNPASIFQFQINEAEFYKKIFQSIGQYENRDSYNLIVKLHPSFKLFNERGVYPFIKNLAAEAGIKNVIVLTDFLEEAITTADYLIFSHPSSVIKNAFDKNIPMALMLPQYTLDQYRKEKLIETDELIKNDILHMIFDEKNIFGFLKKYGLQQERKKLGERIQKIKNKWRMKTKNVEEISADIVKWVAEKNPQLIAENNRQSENAATCKTTKAKPLVSFLSLETHVSACPVLRLAEPLKLLEKRGEIKRFTIDLYQNKLTQIPIDQFRNVDILIIQRNFPASVSWRQLINSFKGNAPKIIYEFDDAFDQLPETHPGYDYYQQMAPHFIEYIKNADAVTVSTTQLKNDYLQYNHHIFVLPNSLIKGIWGGNFTKPQLRPDKVKILFAGTGGHKVDLDMIESALQKIVGIYKHKVEVVIWTHIETELEKLPHFKKETKFRVNYYEYAEALKKIDVDFALIPLLNEPSNNAKSNIKWLEYSACKIAGIYSKSPAYNASIQHQKTGLLVENNENDWFEAIQYLIENPKQRKRIAENAYQKVWQKHALDFNLSKWMDVYHFVLNKPKTIKPAAMEKPFAKEQNLPLVSIIIPLLNKKEYTKKCLESLYKNTDKALFELILVDNASTDGTKFLLKKWKNEYENITVMNNKKNEGFAKANNKGVHNAKGKYILFLNNDTEPQPGWLEALLKTIENNPAVGAVGSKLLYSDGTIQHAGVLLVDNTVGGDPLLALHHFHHQPGDLKEANTAKTYQALTAACLLLRKDIFIKAEQFDAHFYNGYEDVDLCLKIGALGYQLVYQPQSVVIHHESKSGGERWKKVNENINLLHQKWIGKVNVDLRVQKDGSQRWTEAHKVKPYFPTNLNGNEKMNSYDKTAAKVQEIKIPTPQNEAAKNKPQKIASIATANNSGAQELVSIILLTWNALKYTKKTIDSILKNTAHNYEIIIVDNASSDGTVKYLKQLSKKHRHIKTYFNKENRGFAAGNNQAVKKANGAYIMILNNDILVGENWLSGMMRALHMDERIGVVGPLTNRISGLQMVANTPYHDAAGFFKYAQEFRGKYGGNITPRRRLAGFAMLMRKSLYQNIGGFDEDFGSGNYEDDDLCMKVRKRGFALMVDEGTFIHHYTSQTFKANHIDILNSLDEKEEIFFEKWPDVDYEEMLEMKNPLKKLHLKLTQDASALMEDGRFEEAHTVFDEILADHPLHGESLLGKALCYRQTEQQHKAYFYILKLLKSQPYNAFALNQAGILAHHFEEWENALTFFKKAFELNPDLIEARRNYGNILIDKGEYEKGINEFQAILKHKASDVETLLIMASLFMESERYEQARYYIETALKYDADNEQAIELLNRVEANKKENGNVEEQDKLELAATLLNDNKVEEALNIYNQLFIKKSTNFSVVYGQAICYRLLEKNDLARVKFSTLLEQDAAFMPALQNLANIELIEGNLERSLDLYTRASEIDGENILLKQALSDILIELGRYDEGVKMISEALKADPQNVDTLLRMGKIYYEANRENEAKKYLQEVIKMDPHNETANVWLKDLR